MNKITVITGATKGIGKAIAIKFASEGFDLAVCARSQEDLEELKKNIESSHNAKVHIRATDVSVKSDVRAFSDFANSLDGEIDVLVNNAGVFTPGQIHTEEEGILEKMMDTNLYSAYYLTRGLIGGMKARRTGYVFNICSTASLIPYSNGGSYCISKFAMLGMSKVLREEMKEFGVRVSSVMPGATYTASWEGADLPEDRFMKAEDVAEAVWGAYRISDRTVIEEIVMRPQLGDL